MGSEALSDPDADAATRAYQTLISLMLSSQTRDVVTAETMFRLRAHGLSVDRILDETDDETLHALIAKVGFHNLKTKYIRKATQILRDEHAGMVPDTMQQLIALPGVGPKMALIVLRVAHGVTAGIAVDTHVHRIANQLGWTGASPTKTPEHTRRAIESWMPEEIWDEVNILLVGLGQESQTERARLIRKALASEDPRAAILLLKTLKVNVAKVAKAQAISLPPELQALLLDTPE